MNQSKRMQKVKQEKYKRAKKYYDWQIANSANLDKTAKHFRVSKNHITHLYRQFGFRLHRKAGTTPHGSVSRYNTGCRCDVCVQGNNTRMREYFKALPKYPRRAWSENEIKFLLQNYEVMGPMAISKKLERSYSGVTQMYRKERDKIVGNATSNNSKTHRTRKTSSSESLQESSRYAPVQNGGGKIRSLLSKVRKGS